MSYQPDYLVMAFFREEKMAQVVLRDLQQMQVDKLIEIEQTATLRRDAGTGLHLIDDAPAGDNAWATGTGGIIGAILKAMTGPEGLAAEHRPTAAEASAFADQFFYRLSRALLPGDSCLLLVIQAQWKTRLEDILALAKPEEVLIEAMQVEQSDK